MDNEAHKGKHKSVTVAEYRKLLNDQESTDERIQERLDYLNAFCRNIIRNELEKYRNGDKNTPKITSI